MKFEPSKMLATEVSNFEVPGLAQTLMQSSVKHIILFIFCIFNFTALQRFGYYFYYNFCGICIVMILEFLFNQFRFNDNSELKTLFMYFNVYRMYFRIFDLN